MIGKNFFQTRKIRWRRSDSFFCSFSIEVSSDRTMWKLWNELIPLVLLKAKVERAIRKLIIYIITCSWCLAYYVGQTDRYVLVWFREHTHPSQPIGKHLREWGVKISFDNKDVAQIIQATINIFLYLEALIALWQRDIKPPISTREEYKLTTKFQSFNPIPLSV